MSKPIHESGQLIGVTIGANGNGAYDNGNGHVRHDVLPPSRPAAAIEGILANAPTLGEVGINILKPHERKDAGAIEYSTAPEVLHNWAEDPHGVRKLEFISEAYGIPQDRVVDVLVDAGMGEWMNAKAEGRFVGMVSTQVLKPTYYFMANPIMLGELHRQGVPTALMVGEYTQDTFYSGNSDKRDAFGKLNFPVGIREKHDKKGDPVLDDQGRPVREVKSAQIELRPYGIRHDDGTIQRITTIDEANGFRCEQVLVQVASGRGPDNQGYASIVDHEKIGEDGIKRTEKITTTHAEAALGIRIPGLVNKRATFNHHEEIDTLPIETDAISITDFHRTLWIETVNRLRETGDLPSEDDMPMFFVDGSKLYRTLAQEAQPPQKTLDLLGFGSERQILDEVLKLPEDEIARVLSQGRDGFTAYLEEHNLRQLDNGLLVHNNGMMDPSSYYAAQTAWPDGYLECSSCGGDYFVDKVARGQVVQQAYGVPDAEIRLPDAEVPDLEGFVVHPTGRYFDYQIPTNQEVIDLNTELKRVKGDTRIAKEDAVARSKQIQERIGTIQNAAKDEYRDKLGNPDRTDYADVPLAVPDTVAAVYKHLFTGIPEMAKTESVVKAKEYVRTKKRPTTARSTVN